MISPRIDALRSNLGEHKLDAILVSSLPNIRYLSGFTGSHALCLLTSSNQFLLTDGRYVQQARSEVTEFQTRFSSGSLFELMRAKKIAANLRRVGYESQTMTVAEFANLKKFFPRLEFIPSSFLIPSLRAIKDSSELASIRGAVEISDKVFQKILGIIKSGMTERAVAAEITYWHARYGAEADAFEPIVASGIRGALPHGRASEKKIQRGELVTLDFGCRYRGYHSDLTRTVSVGPPTSELKKIHRIVLEAQERATEFVKTGIATKKIDAIARSFIVKKKFGKYFNHSLGHGIGLEVHESPHVSRFSKERLATGNVITIEPGVYIPRFGGVRIEDDVLVTTSGGERLNRSPKELLVL
jgi:Xaa-Pro aminopeptidase